MTPASSIAEVINRIDEIISWCRQRQQPMGYFAMLYRRMTVAVREGMSGAVFDDPARMERLDVAFANRYLSAWDAYTHQQPCSNAWYTTFEACGNSQLVVLQHLVAGINAHINLDLGIAAADIAPGNAVLALQKDFDRVNDIIASLTAGIQASLENIWLPLRVIGPIVNEQGGAVLNFSITSARKAAWANAVALSLLPEDMRAIHIKTIDNAVVSIAQRIIHPGIMTDLLLSAVRKTEFADVSRNMDLLAG